MGVPGDVANLGRRDGDRGAAGVALGRIRKLNKLELVCAHYVTKHDRGPVRIPPRVGSQGAAVAVNKRNPETKPIVDPRLRPKVNLGVLEWLSIKYIECDEDRVLV